MTDTRDKIAKCIMDGIYPIGMADAILALIREEAWQPIETAPKDGSKMLLLGKEGNVYSPCQWEDGEISENGFWLWWQTEPEWLTEVKEPTHWMPLPKPPCITESSGVEP